MPLGRRGFSMGIFKRAPKNEHLERAKKQFKECNYQQSLNTLSWGFETDVENKELYKLAIRCLEKLGAKEEIKLFRNALSKFNKFQPFFELGYYFVDCGLYDEARPFLEKAVRIEPNEPNVASELAIVHRARFNIEEAIRVLSKVDYQSDFYLEYLFQHCKLLNSQTEGIQEFIEKSRQSITQESVEDFDEAQLKLEELSEALVRHGVIEKPERIVRDWHFIQYGAAILDYSEDEDEYVAGGRYVAYWGDMESVREVLQKLKLYLERLNKLPKTLIYLEDRDSEIIGRAIGMLLDLPVELYTQGIETSDSLVVAADNHHFNGLEEFKTIGFNQTIFALNLNWLKPAMLTPDIAGFLTQNYVFPWTGGALKILDAKSRKFQKTEPDNRKPDQIAYDLSHMAFEISSTFEETLNFYENKAPYLKGGFKANSNRINFRSDSPVPGSRFRS